LFFWLPASYHTPPAAVGALLAGLLTKVGVYSMIRVFTLLFPSGGHAVYTVLLAMSAVTMIVGRVAALSQTDLRRVLSFNLVGHIGFITVALAMGTADAIAAAILYLLHEMLAITALFLVGGWFLRQRRTATLARLGSLYREQPAVAAIAMVPIFSFAGVPPLSGFIAKVSIVVAALGSGFYWVTAAVLVTSLLTLLSMAVVWGEAFWKPAATEDGHTRIDRLVAAPAAALAIAMLAFTVAAGPLFDLSRRAAGELLRADDYVDAVLRSR
jgi:multicomponent Na+:H+ antiporter subunit D